MLDVYRKAGDFDDQFGRSYSRDPAIVSQLGAGFRILPDTAARWQVSADGRTYTFFLRPDVRFADGTNDPGP